MKNGRGKLYFNNTHVFEGYFKDDSIHGTGSYHMAQGKDEAAVYMGEWSNN